LQENKKPSKAEFECPVCHMTVETEDEFERHMRKEHNEYIEKKSRE
jgi:uncharacterized C2H2 Zn-finger protein